MPVKNKAWKNERRNFSNIYNIFNICNIRIVLLLSFFVITLSLTHTVFAVEEGTVPAQDGVVRLVNPIGGTNEKPEGNVDWNNILGFIIKTGMGVIGSLALVVFLYGGFEWLTSRGNSEKIKSGLDAMMYGAIGLCIIFASYAILNFVFKGLGG